MDENLQAADNDLVCEPPALLFPQFFHYLCRKADDIISPSKNRFFIILLMSAQILQRLSTNLPTKWALPLDYRGLWQAWEAK
jgi:hypothetical protein